MSGTGVWRWVSWTNDERGHWHLRAGGFGKALCDVHATGLEHQRWLAEGAPARRCPDCLTVAALRLGIVPVTSEPLR